jgi:hypothetical protein
MASDRTQRRVERLLGEAEAATDVRDWARVSELSQEVLAFDPENPDARSFRDASARQLDSGAAPSTEAKSAPVAAPVEIPTPFANGRYRVKRFLGEAGMTIDV